MATMENRPLKLHIAKGPRQGEELEFKPGSRIRIGRVVRGNNVVIKDAGISSKHLSIELDTRSGNWILQDLGSSNGTIINGSSNALSVSPNSPYSINDGDSIKIGESTSILVRLDSCVVEVSELPQNPRRRGKPAAGRRNSKEYAATGVVNESEKAAGVLNETLGLKDAYEIRKKKVDDGIVENNGEEKKSNLGVRTRASSRNQNEGKDVKRFKTVVVAADNVNVVEDSNLEEETGQSDQMCSEKNEDLGCREKGNESAANDHSNEAKPDLCVDGPTVDLAKLTVRDFFDYLEVNLLKQIVDETNKSLAAMRGKVEHVQDYVREQRKKKKNSGEQAA